MSNPSERKLAVVTGASSGIGAVYADRLAARGYDLLLIARRRDRLTEVARRIGAAHGRKVEVLVADLAAASDLSRVADNLAGREDIEVLVNNAGIARFSPIAQGEAADSEAQIALNVTALTRLTHAVLPGLVARDRGTVINLASVLSVASRSFSAVYSGTKAYVMLFSRGLQAELAGTNVKVHSLHPAITATEIWEQAGVSLDNFEAGKVMKTETMVDAALVGLDRGEAFTWPSVADDTLWKTFEAASDVLFAAGETGSPAPRYVTA